MKNLRKSLVVITAVLALSACCGPDQAIKQTERFISKQTIDKTAKHWKTQLPKPDKVIFSSNKDYFWELDTTQGKLVIKLFPEVAPMHVSSTLYLTQLGFYDGLTFHRVIPGFMAQGGDPIGNGRGNPGYKYAGEFDASASHNKSGMLSMANAGPDTDGSQFFITFGPTPFLDGKHTVFGEVVEGGTQSLSAIEKLGSRRGQTKSPVIIHKAIIRVEAKQ